MQDKNNEAGKNSFQLPFSTLFPYFHSFTIINTMCEFCSLLAL
jgi:hypothetical protein